MTVAWREHWFPIAFKRDLEPGRVERVLVLGRALAVFLDEKGEPAALVDRCPHRNARLSDGRVHEGVLECLYHGWRFDRSGACVEAPQQPRNVELPRKSCAQSVPVCVEQGLVFAWGGAAHPTADQRPPTIDTLDRANVKSVDFAMDLPYGQDAFIENVLDVAHIHVAHDGSRGGGDRRLAGPLEVEIEHESASGFRANFHTLLPDGAPRTHGIERATVEFRAPNLVHYVSKFADPSQVSGLALYSLPCDAGRSRVLYRAYGNLWSRADLARPRWKEHLSQCYLFEEDMAVVRGQVEEIDSSSVPLAELWLPLRWSDRVIVCHREWIERYAADRPGAVGLRATGQRGVITRDAELDRWSLHTRICADCRAAYTRCTRHASRWTAGALVAGAAAIALPWPFASIPAVAALGALFAAQRDRRSARSLTLTRDPGGRRSPHERIEP